MSKAICVVLSPEVAERASKSREVRQLQPRSSLAPGGQMRDPGNEVAAVTENKKTKGFF